jgi:hypothetical protein
MNERGQLLEVLVARGPLQRAKLGDYLVFPLFEWVGPGVFPLFDGGEARRPQHSSLELLKFISEDSLTADASPPLLLVPYLPQKGLTGR